MDAVAVTREYVRQGFTRIHLIDLDAATGAGSNEELVRETVRTSSLESQVGGGLHEPDGVAEVLDAGARWAVVAARALPHLDLIANLAHQFPGEIILSVAIRGPLIEVESPLRSLPQHVVDFVEELDGLPLAAILLRATDREGSLAGADLHLVEDAVNAGSIPIITSGGIGSIGQLRNLEERGASGVVIGTALHAGILNSSAVAAEFAA